MVTVAQITDLNVYLAANSKNTSLRIYPVIPTAMASPSHSTRVIIIVDDILEKNNYPIPMVTAAPPTDPNVFHVSNSNGIVQPRIKSSRAISTHSKNPYVRESSGDITVGITLDP
jgi:hypothetical protein